MSDTVKRNQVVYLTYTIWDQAGRLFEQYDLPIANGIPADGGDGGASRLR